MGKLGYSALASLDGYTEDAEGNFGWARPDEEAHRFFNDLARTETTQLYGRRMYETMVYWETVDTADAPDYLRDFAELWRAAEKIVYTKTLTVPRSERTRIEPKFDVDAVRQLKEAAPGDLAIGGPGLAASAFEAGLIDEVHLVLAPIVIGAGKPALPAGLQLELIDEQRFTNGWLHLHYAALTSA